MGCACARVDELLYSRGWGRASVCRPRLEEHWFQRVFPGEDRSTGMSMDVPAEVTRDEFVAACRQACARSDEIAGTCPGLSTMAKIASPGENQAGRPPRPPYDC